MGRPHQSCCTLVNTVSACKCFMYTQFLLHGNCIAGRKTFHCSNQMPIKTLRMLDGPMSLLARGFTLCSHARDISLIEETTMDVTVLNHRTAQASLASFNLFSLVESLLLRCQAQGILWTDRMHDPPTWLLLISSLMS